MLSVRHLLDVIWLRPGPIEHGGGFGLIKRGESMFGRGAMRLNSAGGRRSNRYR